VFYVTLASIFTTSLACRPSDRNLVSVLKTRGWKYALVALTDVEANFLVVKAYQFTTLTSVQVCMYLSRVVFQPPTLNEIMLLDLKKEEIVSITRPQLLIYDNLVQSYR